MQMPAAPPQPRKKLGEIFVEQGIISAKTCERVLQRAQQLNRRFGSVLEDLDLISGEELASALAAQYGCRPLSNLARLRVPPELLKLVPFEAAMQHLIFPLKREGDRLAVATADPTESKALSNLAADSGLQIIPFVATRQEIREAISRHYLGKPAARPDSRTVLAVDDDGIVRTQLSESLGKAGYRVVTARDGMEAFKLVISESPHVVISDMEMPKLDGYGLLNALRNIPETSHIPVIMITGRARNEEEELKAFQKGFFDVIMKPFTQASVLARVRRAFHFYDNQYRLF